eukprot:3757869-Amphidinium_carterae.1
MPAYLEHKPPAKLEPGFDAAPRAELRRLPSSRPAYYVYRRTVVLSWGRNQQPPVVNHSRHFGLLGIVKETHKTFVTKSLRLTLGCDVSGAECPCTGIAPGTSTKDLTQMKVSLHWPSMTSIVLFQRDLRVLVASRTSANVAKSETTRRRINHSKVLLFPSSAYMLSRMQP